MFFRHELAGVYSASDAAWDKANKIRTWLTRLPYKVGMPGLESRVPREAYEQMKSGQPVLCGNLADIYVGLCESAGLTARGVGLSVAVQNGGFGVDTHAGAEVWVQEFNGWIYEDPTFNCYWKVDGKPASALALHDALMSGHELVFAPTSADTKERLTGYYIDPRLYFRHISYEYEPGGTVLYFADKRLEPLSLVDKNWVHTSNRQDFERLDSGGNLIVERRAQIAPGIFVQLNWTIADAQRGSLSMGTIEPERISEIVSDVVESKSGYLDVQFDTPSGGAFRVLDVIVAEAPRFTDKPARPAGDAAHQTSLLR